MKWRPIAEAPQDGSRVVCTDGRAIWLDAWKQLLARFEEPQWTWAGHKATHFISLPSPPAAEGGGE
jgi:hypothetical protein